MIINDAIRLADFDCGSVELNEFLKEKAHIYLQESLAKTILFICDKEIIGYVTICADNLRLTQHEKKMLKKMDLNVSDFPAFKVARLAVDRRHQKKGYGKYILFWAMGHIEEVASHAARYVIVDAKAESLPFYQRFKFRQNLHERHNKPNKATISLRFDLHELAST